MRTDDIREYLKNAKPIDTSGPKVNKTVTPELIQLSLCDVFGKVYSNQIIGRKEQLIVKSLTFYMAQKNGITEQKMHAELRRFLQIPSLVGMNLGQYEAALDYLTARAT